MSRASSSCTPAAASAAATSSPILNNWISSTVRSRARRSNRWCWSRTMVRSTPARSLAALAARAHWLTVEWLPKYAPELNDIERVWHDLKANHLAHQTFAHPEALKDAIHQAVEARNQQRGPLPSDRLRISA